MSRFFDLGKETEPCFLRDDPSEYTSRIGHQQLPSAELDKKLLDKFKRRVRLNSDGCLCGISPKLT